MICAIKGETNDDKLVRDIEKVFSAKAFFSVDERAFFDNPAASRRDLAKLAWRYECAHVFAPSR